MQGIYPVISKGNVVQFFYTLSDKDGQQLESTDEQTPMAYLHGYNNMMPALEEAMEGKSAGDTLQVTLAPEDAYGVRQPEGEIRIPIKHLQGAKKWKPGMVATVNTDQGKRQVTVLKLGKFMATVDTNHPLAGKTVTFDITIGEIRDATTEELSHGHAHGVGGHQH